jgi:ABC-type transport system involved in Fe-S cluster assembly fused permease/ATPase subunit
MKNNYLSTTFFCLFVFLFSIAAKSQTLTSADIKAQMVKDWERAKAYTVDYLNTMPADKYGFRPNDSTRSFAQQMLHLAGANVFLMMTAASTPPASWLSMTLESRTSAQTKDSVMYYITSSYDYCINTVRAADVNKWGETVKVFNTYDVTRFAMTNKTFEHQDHHRGQTTIYIRLNGIKPPQERLF